MTCERIRVALSARLDGEDPGLPAATVDGHVDDCAGCRGWLAGAARVDRAVRLPGAPDLTAGVLAAVGADRVERERAAEASARSRRQILRIAVAVAAVAQLGLALPVLLTGLGVPGDAHASREMASFDIALAVGFALAAYRPQQARTFVPVAFVLAACLAATSAMDMANATTALVHEAGHLAAMTQAALLWALGRATPQSPAASGPATVPA
jgi:predicted anti-sigma-YlaC factor YlaD